MANVSTVTLAQILEFSSKLNFGRVSNLGNFQEPAMTAANMVMQTLLGPPFRWRWNRQVKTFSTIIATQDYAQAVANFGWIEDASVFDPTIAKWIEMEEKVGLALDSTAGRPRNISAEFDNGTGNITFRFMPIPEKIYSVSVTIQSAAPLFTSTAQTLTPLPDMYSHIFQWGFLTLMWFFADDPRAAQANGKFVSALLAANQGLTEVERNVFLSQWSAISGQPMMMSQNIQQGTAARGQ
jgi:hypothetical protein